jgi:D-serine dehydratase
VYIANDTLIARILNLNNEVVYLKGSVKQSDALTTKAVNATKNLWSAYIIGSASIFNAGVGIGVMKGKFGGQVKAVSNFTKTGIELAGNYKIY